VEQRSSVCAWDSVCGRVGALVCGRDGRACSRQKVCVRGVPRGGPASERRVIAIGCVWDADATTFRARQFVVGVAQAGGGKCVVCVQLSDIAAAHKGGRNPGRLSLENVGRHPEGNTGKRFAQLVPSSGKSWGCADAVRLALCAQPELPILIKNTSCMPAHVHAHAGLPSHAPCKTAHAAWVHMPLRAVSSTRTKCRALRWAAGCTLVAHAPAHFLAHMPAQVPPHGKGSLYIRPLLMGSGPILGLGPAPEYTFTIYAAAVGAYFKVQHKPRMPFKRCASRATCDPEALVPFKLLCALCSVLQCSSAPVLRDPVCAPAHLRSCGSCAVCTRVPCALTLLYSRTSCVCTPVLLYFQTSCNVCSCAPSLCSSTFCVRSCPP